VHDQAADRSSNFLSLHNVGTSLLDPFRSSPKSELHKFSDVFGLFACLDVWLFLLFDAQRMAVYGGTVSNELNAGRVSSSLGGC
jgi:hypothetical protein